MQRLVCRVTEIWISLLLLVVTSAGAQGSSAGECLGVYKDHHRPAVETLSNLLQAHAAWLAQRQSPDGQRADLCGANLVRADLRNVNLAAADLRYANLSDANLQGANLTTTDLRHANLSGANLRGALLQGARLHGATLLLATLQGSQLGATDLAQVNLWGADLTAVVFEPQALPPVDSLAAARHLAAMTFVESPQALYAVREAFKGLGWRTQERQITYAIHRGRRRQASLVESVLRFTLFELTCQYGMAPTRPLYLLGLCCLLFAIPYATALYRQDPPEAAFMDVPGCGTAMSRVGQPARQRWQTLWYGLEIVLCSLLLSLGSLWPFGTGRDQKNGQTGRVFRRYALLRTVGWIRHLIWLQSGISIYLLALWLFITLGHTFR